MPLSELLEGIVDGPFAHNPAITGLALDDRQLTHGGLFLAVPGTHADGRDFLAGAFARGAAAALYESSDGWTPPTGADFAIPVAGLRERIGLIADRFFGSPSRQLFVIGVTGTNGKTTCATLLAQALDRPDDHPNARCGVIGTLGSGFPDAIDPGTHTTPDAISVHALLADLKARGARWVCMEVSSHALDQGRVQGVAFDIAVFTNLTRDHLDYHGDMASYAAAKARLFDFPALKAVVINVDDSFGREIAERASCRTWRFAQAHAAEVRARSVTPTDEGLALEVKTPAGPLRWRSPLLGRFNAENLLAVAATLLAAGRPVDEIHSRLTRARPAPGRMERFGGEGRPVVVVDYAHTPDALEKVLCSLREHVRGQLWCVFGCGGNRDRGKRPQMGAIAERGADVVVLTNDNPRHESPAAIIEEIRAGMQSTPIVIPDRAQAIAHALREAAPGDFVLVAGKGHEDYQQIGDRRLPYSDRETVRVLLGEAA
jgi:UDP-N-acetylmuramoyl-L-alanyl-D-glutamate--2,6-diaminopimelate ligase